MKLFHSLSEYKAEKKSIVTIGTFDGVHMGHKLLLEKLIQNTKEQDCESVVLTFFPHPRMVLQESSDVKLINTIEEKSELIKKIGIENLIIHPFDQKFSRLTAEEFVKTILVDVLNVQKIIIGYDHRFGRNRTANINDLIVYGKQYNFEVEQISAQEINNNAVSSTKIRNAILEGNISLANKYLGYNYTFSGEVVKGKQLGRTIGFPTANIQIKESYKLIPKSGVYIVKSNYKGQTIFGMMNIGNRPTVNGENQTIEVNFLNFNEDIYTQIISVEILEFVRDEQKFDSLNSLKEQLKNDQLTSLNYISKI
ncbi:bifunctional riboflavin kinase/FAD synthetase [Flavobacterium aquatile]|uniref:Riboflavin biosynthesis protein n=1 Tax=Flavobacterium aquatile LMG 4008 = ATCC 11947 TaxID=1453498 RepID=A0A095U307_9FLAO|nr:bifunctional riboflavin kinase/FAD synthetase [Flavobacterium aquatile]KGD68978.1 riboflavin biosynthesis protein RibF [Flavobacterium aquatile LMG 4008 = ATCC 11947]OXA65913.1 riboflavin biosynthesis protein RibF [Flavobacterium aquatile LMG 4008 = ATCC 11947]